MLLVKLIFDIRQKIYDINQKISIKIQNDMSKYLLISVFFIGGLKCEIAQNNSVRIFAKTQKQENKQTNKQANKQ